MAKRKPRSMGQETWDYMLEIFQFGGCTVCACSLLKAAWLVEAGYAKVEDDYEGPRIYLADSGIKLVSD